MFEYTILAEDGLARVGELQTPHGVIRTPVFMPVGTHGAVKAVSPTELKIIGSQIILANTYHLYLRPGEEIVASAGGLHGFMNWSLPILTDSGGFQVFSLGERGMSGQNKKSMRQVSEEGITFQSHLDGSRHLFTPEHSVLVQQKLGADIIMAFDQPVYGLSDHSAASEAMQRSGRWLKRSVQQWKTGDTARQALFGIVQGGTYQDLHQQSAREVVDCDLAGNAIGGLSVGEDKARMWEAVLSITALLPYTKPRYFMGLGEPLDIIEATLRGVDMYDCVAPSRLARHGVVWQVEGEKQVVEAFWQGDLEYLLSNSHSVRFARYNLHNQQFKTRTDQLVHSESRLPDDLKKFTYAALHHYIKENEMLGYRILTLHNCAILTQITLLLTGAIQKAKTTELAAVCGLPHK